MIASILDPSPWFALKLPWGLLKSGWYSRLQISRWKGWNIPPTYWLHSPYYTAWCNGCKQNHECLAIVQALVKSNYFEDPRKKINRISVLFIWHHRKSRTMKRIISNQAQVWSTPAVPFWNIQRMQIYNTRGELFQAFWLYNCR